jgi:hypothetical protein
MRRLLHITLILYFVLLLAAAGLFYLGFRPDRLAGAPAIIVFFLWLADGLALMAAGIALLRRVIARIYPASEAIRLAVLSLLATVLGAAPAFIIVELVYKLGLFLQARP